MIINVRGTSGSGKTYAVRQLMEHLEPCGEVYGTGDMFPESKVLAHVFFHELQPVFVIGDYSSSECGGCDKIRTQNKVCALIRHFSQFGHVIFEGMILSNNYSRYVTLAEELEGYGEKFAFMYLTTPIEVCLEQVRERRLAAGNTDPLDPTNTVRKHDQVVSCWEKMVEADVDARPLVHDGDVGQQLLDVLSEHPWPFESSYKEQSFR